MERWLSVILTTVAVSTNAQSTSTIAGGRALGLANSAIAISDEWALRNNPAGLASLKNTNIAFALHRTPALLGANRMAMAANLPTSAGTFSMGAFRFGDDLYSEQLASVGFGHKLGLASLGARADYIQYRAEATATTSAIGITVGGIAHITPAASIGASVTNVNHPKLPNGEGLPIKLATGACFKSGKNLLLAIEVEKYIDFDPTIKGGVEYQIHKKFFVRSGFNLHPNAAFFGLGLQTWRIKIDCALQYSVVLSNSHQASVYYQIDKKKKSG